MIAYVFLLSTAYNWIIKFIKTTNLFVILKIN